MEKNKKGLKNSPIENSFKSKNILACGHAPVQSLSCISYKDMLQNLNILAVLVELNPQDRGSYYILDCPVCGVKEAFLYKNSQTHIKCSRLNNCGATTSLWEYIKEKNHLKDNKAVFEHFARLSGTPINLISSYEDNTKEFKNTLKEIATLKVDAKIVNDFNQVLLNNNELLAVIKNKVGLTDETVRDLKIGFSQTHDMWMFPCIDMDDNTFGAEFRPIMFTQFMDYDNKLRKVKRPQGTNSRLCKINNARRAKNLIVVEGFKDGYTLYQYLKEHQLDYEYQVVTPSCGVGTIANLLAVYDLDQYDKLILSLDNDKAGRTATKSVINTISKTVYELKLPYSNEKFKDFTDWYLIAGNKELELFSDDYNVRPNNYSLAKKYIKGRELAHPYKVSIEENVALIKQIIVFNNCYFEIWSERSEKTNDCYFCYKRLTNYYVNFMRELINYDENDLPICSLEVEIIKYNGEKSPKFVLEGNSKQDIAEFIRTTSSRGSYSSLLNSTHLAKLIDKLGVLNKIYCFEKSGLITSDDMKMWLYKDAAVNLKTGEVFNANSDGIIDFNGKNIMPKIDNKACKLGKKTVINPQQTAHALIESLLESYTSTIEPFIVLGTAILAPFRDLLKSKTNDGFPVCYMYGSAKSGKTNLARIISALYGFGENYITSGNSTDNAILDDLGRSNRIPVIVDEFPIKRRFEELLKSIYECSGREIMKRNGIDKVVKPVNATAMFISNFAPPDNEQVMSRLNFTTFTKNNFNVTQARRFNEIRENLLSFVLPEILGVKEQQISDVFDICRSIITEANKTMSQRDINNLAIAYTGITILLEIAQWQDIGILHDAFLKYIKNFGDLCNAESSLDKFIAFATTLKNNGVLNNNRDYKFIDDGKIAINMSTSIMNAFYKEYKQVMGESAPNKRDILNAAKNDRRVELDAQGYPYKNVYIGGRVKKCMVLNVADMDDIEELRSI